MTIVNMEDLPEPSAPVASDCTPEYGVAPKRIGCYAHGGQAMIPKLQAGRLWEVDKVDKVDKV